jgi:hypothetical protein
MDNQKALGGIPKSRSMQAQQLAFIRIKDCFQNELLEAALSNQFAELAGIGNVLPVGMAESNGMGDLQRVFTGQTHASNSMLYRLGRQV